VYDLETSRIGAPYIYDISNLRVNVKNELSCTSTLPYAFMVWTGHAYLLLRNVVIVSCNQHILKTGVTTTLTKYNETVTKVTLLCTNPLYAQHIQIIFNGPIRPPFEWIVWAPSQGVKCPDYEAKTHHHNNTKEISVLTRSTLMWYTSAF